MLLMLSVLTPKDRTTALAKLVTMEMGGNVKVRFCVVLQLKSYSNYSLIVCLDLTN